MIGIVFINDIGHSPYIAKYIDSITEAGLDYEVISWDREPHKGRTYPENYKIFKLFSLEEKHPINKIIDFIRFGRFANKKVKEKRYDKLIILTSLTGIILYRTLKKSYRQKYIFDYRDASYEFLPLFKKMIAKLVTNSYFTCVSSRGFLEILPPADNYVVVHNFQYGDLRYKEAACTLSRQEPIHVNYIGYVRGYYLLKMIDLFARDKRFVLNFHGGGEHLNITREHASGIDNIHFTGEYRGNEKHRFIKQADLICYNYESSFINDKALANKYYDALIFKKPLLGNSQTYSGRLISQNGLGISLDLDDPLYTQKIYDFYMNFSCAEFNRNAERVLAEVLEEDQLYMEKIREFINK